MRVLKWIISPVIDKLSLSVQVTSVNVNRSYVVDIEFNPTVPHCSLATLIGLCMRVKVERCLLEKIKLDIHIKEGAHDTEDESRLQALKIQYLFREFLFLPH